MFLAVKMHCTYKMLLKKKTPICFVTINILPSYVFNQCYHQIQTSLTCEQHF